jgi:MYXO-CTERM domain-containing protein
VLQPPTKVRHGLFRFAVAGARGAGGTEMTLDLSYDGVTLCSSAGAQQPCAPRVLPIGGDVWTADGGAEGVGGGCTCSAAGTSRRPPLGGVATLVAMAALVWRRRRSGRRAQSEDGAPAIGVADGDAGASAKTSAASAGGTVPSAPSPRIS